jgi:hypothetical protein
MSQELPNKGRWQVAIPVQSRREGLSWLLIEHDAEDTAGYFLFEHETLSGPCKSDTWHETLKAAQRQAQRDWGVTPEQWQRNSPTRPG